MGMENYITRLRNAMLWRYSNREIALTLEDVSSVFEEGRRRGRTDQEIAEELGTPEEFVLALAREGGPLPKRGVMQKKVLIIAILCAATAYLVMLENNMLENSDAHWNNFAFCAAAACIPALICFAAGAGLYCAGQQEARVRRKYILCLLVSILLTGFEQFMLAWACRSAQAPVLKSYYVVWAMIAIAVVLLAVLVVRLFRGDAQYMGLFSILFGTVCSSVVYCDFIRRFEAVSQNPWAFICVFPCMIGIVFSGLPYIWSSIKRRMF